MRPALAILLLGLVLGWPSAARAQAEEAGFGIQGPPASVDSVATPGTLEPIRRAQRSARTAIAMSLVVPGWGQLYADSPLWSVVAFGVQSWYLGNILLERRRVERQRVLRDREDPDSAARADRSLLVDEHRERIRDFVWWGAGGMLIIALDSYVSVELADFDSADPPTPDLDRAWPSGGGSGVGIGLRLDFGF